MLTFTLLIILGFFESAARYVHPEFGNPIHTTKLFTEFDPLLGWRKVPNLRGQHVQGEYTIVQRFNSKGFRGPEYSYKKPEGKYRILALGDSFGEGYTVNFEDLFSNLLEKKLRRELDRDIEVINAATGGYGTDQELLLFQHEGKKYQPDLTLLLFYGNDLPANIRNYYSGFNRGQKPLFELKDGKLELKSLPKKTWDREKMLADDRAKHPVKDHFPWRIKDWYLYRLAKYKQTAATENVIQELPDVSKKPDAKVDDKLQVSSDQQRREWEMTEALLAKLNEETKAAGSQFLVVYVPLKREVYRSSNRANTRPSSMEYNLKVISARTKSEFIATTATFQAEATILAKDKKLLYWKRDSHWTPEGHHLTGLILGEHIKKNKERYGLGEK